MARTLEFDKDQALDRAMHIFWRRGYDGTSVDYLERRLGINRGSLYNTFGGKRQLYLAALDRYMDGFVADRMATLDRPGSKIAAIRAVFEDVAAFSVGKGRGIGCFLTNSAVELAPADRAMVRKIEHDFATMEDRFHHVLIAAQQRGEINRSRDPHALARFLMNSLHGLRVMSKVSPDPAGLRQIVDVTVAALQ
jgi:TetR/AcrR family transcriptional repressor of nem operon